MECILYVLAGLRGYKHERDLNLVPFGLREAPFQQLFLQILDCIYLRELDVEHWRLLWLNFKLTHALVVTLIKASINLPDFLKLLAVSITTFRLAKRLHPLALSCLNSVKLVAKHDEAHVCRVLSVLGILIVVQKL